MLIAVLQVQLVELDVIDCGIDHEFDVSEGDVDIKKYPWLGLLYYSFCMYLFVILFILFISTRLKSLFFKLLGIKRFSYNQVKNSISVC